MKKILFCLTMLGVLFSSCNDSFLDRPPLDELTDATYWKTAEHLEYAVNSCYGGLAGKELLNWVESMGDASPWAVSFAWRNIGLGKFTSDLSQINSRWVSAYSYIRRANYFLENYNRAEDVRKAERERYAAEAQFHFAHQYWFLTTLFGDVPYINKTLEVTSPELFMGRTPREQVIDSILTRLENSYTNLPEYIAPASAEFGRISQSAALALMSRIALYNSRWQKASDYAELCMAIGYHEIYTTGNPSEDYVNLFNFTARASRVSANKETILAYTSNYDLGADARVAHNLSRELWVPNDYARFVPTNTMIESYLCSDGLPITRSPLYDDSSYNTIFENRDPRMKQSILAPGQTWNGVNGQNSVVFEKPNLTNDKNSCMTYSGFYIRKYVEPSKVRFVTQDDNDFILIRYAEVLLNYAEAKYRLGTLTQEVVDVTINQLRDRVGMHRMNLAELQANGLDVFAEIQRERQVELFMECHRRFDLNRWGIAHQVMGKELLGAKKKWLTSVNVDLGTMNFKPNTSEGYLVIEDGGTFTNPKHYLLPVPFTQIERNPNLKPNNPGWD